MSETVTKFLIHEEEHFLALDDEASGRISRSDGRVELTLLELADYQRVTSEFKAWQRRLLDIRISNRMRTTKVIQDLTSEIFGPYDPASLRAP